MYIFASYIKFSLEELASLAFNYINLI